MLWHSDSEVRYTEDPPREMLVSPMISAIQYDYFDADFNRWTTEPILRKDSSGNPLVPQRLRIEFKYGKLKREGFVSLPTVPQGMVNLW